MWANKENGVLTISLKSYQSVYTCRDILKHMAKPSQKHHEGTDITDDPEFSEDCILECLPAEMIAVLDEDALETVMQVSREKQQKRRPHGQLQVMMIKNKTLWYIVMTPIFRVMNYWNPWGRCIVILGEGPSGERWWALSWHIYWNMLT